MSLCVVLEFKGMESWPGRALVCLVLRYRRNLTKGRKNRNFNFKKDFFVVSLSQQAWGIYPIPMDETASIKG